MRSQVCALVAVVVAAVACQHGKPVATETARPATPTDVVAAGKAVVEQWHQAYEARNVDALAKLYAHDNEVVLVQDGLPLVGWTTVQGMLQAKLGHAKEIHVRLKDVTVSGLAATVATAAATMTREVSDGVTTVTENGALTLVLRQDADGWKIVVEHYSYKKP
jgi:ketosteroid isomerase-like protein